MNASAKAVEAIDNKKIIKPTSKALVTQDLSVFTKDDLKFFSYVEKELAKLTLEFETRSLPVGADSYNEIHETTMMFVKSRTGLEKNRTLLNKVDNKRVKVRNAFSKEIEAKLKRLEKPWADAKKKADEAKANAEAEAAAAELVRIDKIEKRIVNIRNLSTTITDLESGEKCLSQLDTLEGDLSWAEEFSENATKWITKSRTAVQARVDHYNELIAKEAKIAEQQAEMDRQAEEMKKQQDALAAQQAKLDQQQAEIDRQAQEKADAEDAEKNHKTQEQTDAEAEQPAEAKTMEASLVTETDQASDQADEPFVEAGSAQLDPVIEERMALEDRVTVGLWLDGIEEVLNKNLSFNNPDYQDLYLAVRMNVMGHTTEARDSEIMTP